MMDENKKAFASPRDGSCFLGGGSRDVRDIDVKRGKRNLVFCLNKLDIR